MSLGLLFVGLFVVGFGFFFGDFVFGVFSGWSGRSGWLGVSNRSGNSVAFGGEGGVALNEDDDTFDEAPDAATHDSNVREEHEEAKEEAHEWNLGGQGDHDSGKHDQEEATASQSDVDDAFFVFAKIPVVGTESTEENAKKASGDGRFDAGRDGVLESWVPCWLVSVWRGVWVHKISLVNIIIKLIIAGFGGKSKGVGLSWLEARFVV